MSVVCCELLPGLICHVSAALSSGPSHLWLHPLISSCCLAQLVELLLVMYWYQPPALPSAYLPSNH